MKDFLPIAISLVAVFALVVLISKRFKLSSRYERKPRELNTWTMELIQRLMAIQRKIGNERFSFHHRRRA
jgi:hypothetical protein